MTYILGIVGGIVGAALGWAAVFALALAIGTFVGMSDFEGALAMTAMWGFGPLGGIAGLLSGIWLVLRARGHRSLSAVALRLPFVVLAIAGLATACFWVLYDLRPGLGPSGSLPPRLDFEIRLPPGLTPPAELSRVEIQLNTERNRMPGQVMPTLGRQEGDRHVIAGTVELYYRSDWRLLELVMAPGEPARIFDLKLSARPGHMPAFGPWRRVDFIAVGAEQPRPAPANEAYDLRIRVVYSDQELEEEAPERTR